MEGVREGGKAREREREREREQEQERGRATENDAVLGLFCHCTRSILTLY